MIDEESLAEVVGDLIRGALEEGKLGSGWPLDKRETFAALALMGLTSRLQPLQLNNTDAQKVVIDLAFKLGEMATANSEKK